ncbi:class I SAM-dependent methyltransferase [Trichocoleus sp. DQ-A1]
MELQMQSCPCCWNKRLFAWLLSKGNAGYEKLVSDRKRDLFSDLHGDVLEIGPGTGANFPYYPKDIRWIGIEPNPYMHPYLRKEAERNGLNNPDIRSISAQRLEAEDNSIDAVVSTLVLCSVPDLTATFHEILRVLKPGGRFLFLEHVAARQGTFLRRVQEGVRPVWKFLADGCDPDRETWVALENAGFDRLNYEKFEIDFPIVSPQIAGVATK